jgi:DNA replication and repair protein RecF
LHNLAKNLEEVISKKSGVTRLTLTDFRNYAFLRVNTDLRPVIITGENGSGKTNILEAISFLTPGRGLRNAKLGDIKRFTPAIVNEDYLPGNTSWAVFATVMKNGDEFEIGTAVESNNKEIDEDVRSYDRRIIKIDGQKGVSQADLGQYTSAIWLTPQMDRLFRGGSQPRRNFLDRLVYAFDMEHAKRTSNFEHIYKQWCHLIKNNNGRVDNSWLESLEENMSALGVAIAAARREQTARLNTFIESEHDDIFPNVGLELDGTIEKMLDTMPAIEVEDYYRHKLKSERKNILYNDSADGVNKTDFRVYYKKKRMPADLCSTGEQKSLLISIILAQTKCQILNKGFAPMLLLDEIAAHLDDSKREALLFKIKELDVQAWITATNPNLFSSFNDHAHFMEIKNNGIIEK